MISTNPILTGKVAVVTGGYGVIGSTLAGGLLDAGATVVLVGRNHESADSMANLLRSRCIEGATVTTSIADVTDVAQLTEARESILESHGHIDILVNAAGGNVARARTDHSQIFDMPADAFDEVLKLNLHGTVYPTLVFGEAIASRESGSIVNISSMASLQAISGVSGYSAAKAGVDNFTRWMAVDLARRNGAGIRVNAVAPGFFITKQNKDVLVNADGSFTERSKKILARTPAGRFGDPAELVGPVVWLCSDAASFVTGVVLPVDGGFSAYSGV